MGINVKDARWPGCSAKNFGRFIPCRGGGTATTYYTDAHDVDEDSRTIADCGGAWSDDTAVGVIARDLLTSDTSFSASWIASGRRHPKLIEYYTDSHNVDEDLRTLASQGGMWGYYGSEAGITFRFVFDDPDTGTNTVAYKDKNTTLSTRMVFLMI